MLGRHLRNLATASLTILGVLVAGCNGLIADPGAKPGSSGGPGSLENPEALCNAGIPAVEPRDLRRLSPEQYTNTVRDLLGDPGFTPDVDDAEQIITERGVRQLRGAAELAISRQAEWTRTIFPCDLGGPANDACASELIDQLATRAFRRPITEDEREWLEGVYRDALAELSFSEAMEVVVEVILASPQTVYLREAGTGADGLPDGIRQLTDYELASRLSYFLWNTMPDDELFAAAERGELTTAEGLATQTQRLIEDPRAEAAIQSFFWEWMQLDGGRLHHALEDTDKDGTLYPEYDAELRAAMRTELEAFIQKVVIEEGGSIDALFNDNRAYVNGPLAELYGVTDGPTDADTWEWVELDSSERGGLLTRAAFLTVFSAANVQSPIRRGVFVVEQVLCNELGEPPPNASDVPVEGGSVEGEVLSVRQDVEARTSGAGCNACHSVINPVGFAFENYDAIGRYRTEELTTGLPIDSSGRIQGSDVDRDVADALELGSALSSSAHVRDCLADRWMTRAIGQTPGELDQCALDSARERFAETGTLRDLIVAIVQSDSFRYVNTVGVEE
jgi:hypothetical protein